METNPFPKTAQRLRPLHSASPSLSLATATGRYDTDAKHQHHIEDSKYLSRETSLVRTESQDSKRKDSILYFTVLRNLPSNSHDTQATKNSKNTQNQNQNHNHNHNHTEQKRNYSPRYGDNDKTRSILTVQNSNSKTIGNVSTIRRSRSNSINKQQGNNYNHNNNYNSLFETCFIEYSLLLKHKHEDCKLLCALLNDGIDTKKYYNSNRNEYTMFSDIYKQDFENLIYWLRFGNIINIIGLNKCKLEQLQLISTRFGMNLLSDAIIKHPLFINQHSNKLNNNIYNPLIPSQDIYNKYTWCSICLSEGAAGRNINYNIKELVKQDGFSQTCIQNNVLWFRKEKDKKK